MLNNMKILAMHLSNNNYKVNYKIRNFSNTDIYKYDFFEDRTVTEPNCLYVAHVSSASICNFSQIEGNFLLIHDSNVPITDNQILKANYILLTDVSDISKLYRILRCCCKAFLKLYKHSYDFLNAIYDTKDSMLLLVNTIAQIINHPVALHDQTLHIIYASEGGDLDYLQATSNPEERMQNFLSDFTHGINYPIIFSYESWPDYLIVPIWVNEKSQYILSALGSNGPIQDYEIPFLACAATLFEIPVNNSIISNNKELRINTFFNNIITGNLTSNNEILRTASSIGLFLKEYNHILTIFNTTTTVLYQDVFSLYLDICNNLSYNTVFIYEYTIVIILSNNNIEQAQKLIKEYKAFLKKRKIYGWRGALSFSFLSVCDIKVAYSQCIAAEHFGELLAAKSTILDYKNFMGFHLISQSSFYININDFILPQVKEIIEYDKENETEYAVTLYHYIKNFMNLNSVSKVLNLHRNTISYRINRITELFQIDYNDIATMNNLGLSFDILTCLNIYPYAPKHD